MTKAIINITRCGKDREICVAILKMAKEHFNLNDIVEALYEFGYKTAKDFLMVGSGHIKSVDCAIAYKVSVYSGGVLVECATYNELAIEDTYDIVVSTKATIALKLLVSSINTNERLDNINIRIVTLQTDITAEDLSAMTDKTIIVDDIYHRIFVSPTDGALYMHQNSRKPLGINRFFHIEPANSEEL